MRAIISKWGNSSAIRLSKGIMEAAKFEVGQEVEVVALSGRIEIREAVEFEYDLDELIAQIKPGTKYTDVDWGPPVGKEIW